jgi:hypothetical protein
VRAGTGSRPYVRWLALGVTVMLGLAACSSGDDDDASSDDGGTDTTTPVPEGDITELEVDRSSRFATLDSFCEPATEEPADAPEATDPGITEDSISITHIRVTLEDLQDLGFAIPIGDPADQAEKFVGIINDRCGGINGRQLDLSLVEAPPTAPEGQDPNAIAQAACIEATEDNDAVFAFTGSGWGGQNGASCVTGAHDTVLLTTYNVTQEDLAGADNRLYSMTVSSADGLEYLARTLDEQGALDDKTIGIVMQDSPGDPDIVEQGLIETLEELGHEPVRVDALGCAGGNVCNTGVIESAQGMVADGVDVLFPLLNVINLPAYIAELSTQGVQPGQIQFYQASYHAQDGDLVSSKVVVFNDAVAGELYDGTVIVSPADTGAFRLPDFVPSEFDEMCNREYQEAGGETYIADDPETNSAYGATTGMCAFIRIIARAIEAAGPNPTRADLAAAVEELGAVDSALPVPGSFGPGKYTAPNALVQKTYTYPCPPDMLPFEGDICILPDGEAFPIPSS